MVEKKSKHFALTLELRNLAYISDVISRHFLTIVSMMWRCTQLNDEIAN